MADLQLDQALSAAVCAHICSSVTLVRRPVPAPLLIAHPQCLTAGSCGCVDRASTPRLVPSLSLRFTGSRTFLRHVRCSLRSVPPALLPPGSIECGARARVCVADIGEVGSAAQGQAELGGRTESNLIDVMLALQAGGDGGQASCAELLQLVQTPVPRLPANLLPGGPLSSANIRPSTRPPEGGSLPRRSDLPAPLKSGGREYREVVGFLPALPERHTFVKAELPSMTPDPGSFVNEHSAQRQRTATRRQIEMSLCKLRAAAVVERQQMGGATAGAGGNGNARGGGPTRTVVGLGAALQLSAMNERAGRYKDEGSGSGLWGQEVLSPQTFVSNDALLAAGGGVARESGGGRAPNCRSPPRRRLRAHALHIRRRVHEARIGRRRVDASRGGFVSLRSAGRSRMPTRYRRSSGRARSGRNCTDAQHCAAPHRAGAAAAGRLRSGGRVRGAEHAEGDDEEL